MKAQVVVNQQDKTAVVYLKGVLFRKLPKGLIKRGLTLELTSEEAFHAYFNKLEKKGAERYLIRLLAKKGYLKKQIFQKLENRGFQNQVILELIEKFTQLGFLNDSLFLRGTIMKEIRKGYGRRMAAYKLKMLGFDQASISKALEEFYSKEEERLVLKKMQKKKGLKTPAFWLRRGFDLGLFF